ncbi:MAG TPA: methylenetetrahydrofolate reductase [Burkholderiales bacterium]|nr:methylenetetrahydrofolate reductase [Burkholderiales bacterium]
MTDALANLTSARVALLMAGPTPEEERSSISAFLAGASLEISSRDPAEIDACMDLLERGTALYISFPPGQTYHGTAALAARVARCGFRPVPHFAARRIADRDALDDYLARAVGEAGVDRVLVIGGDNERPSGAFESSLALLETGLFQRHGIAHVDVAGYPEGHPRIDPVALDDALAAKKSLALNAGLSLGIVTQFCFDADSVLSWAARVNAYGLPVRVGLAGPASLTRLLRFAAMCGIGNSVRALKARPGAITRLMVEAGPEVALRQLARNAGAPLAGIHFFCFGGLIRTARWLRAVRDGGFELTEDGGFRVGTA